jgi:hypothetical protein
LARISFRPTTSSVRPASRACAASICPPPAREESQDDQGERAETGGKLRRRHGERANFEQQAIRHEHTERESIEQK